AVGATGAQGVAGNDGAVGATGPQGLPGNDGAAGAVGATGPQGLPGNDGAAGATGAQGVAGNDGAVGATGAQGVAGNDGAVGATGPQGLPGNDGAAGATGAQGLAGNDGAVGATGAQGVPGNDGADGSSIQGPPGPAGTSRWYDNDAFSTVETTGSIKIGDDGATCTNANAGTIRFTSGGFQGCDGTAWGFLTLTPIYAIGDVGPAGGIVFHITEGGLHGMEAAPSDQSSGSWGCIYTYIGTQLPGQQNHAVGQGAFNTAAILAGCSSRPIAASIADTYTLNGFDDWFLPSKNEVALLYQHRIAVGNFSTGFSTGLYCSSTEATSSEAWFTDFSNGSQAYDALGIYNKNTIMNVRPIREF
ncbi:MAG: hypothetical protein GY727_14830, partial [Gammaproteobacteria bacterium]|nr:hypothetical protein [Gammaproteobacteria bacterium]